MAFQMARTGKPGPVLIDLPKDIQTASGPAEYPDKVEIRGCLLYTSLLIGPPGVGKTQIMEQIARECKIGLVAYTITHRVFRDGIALSVIPVSYTHLDVYKRQDMYCIIYTVASDFHLVRILCRTGCGLDILWQINQYRACLLYTSKLFA